jgi:hypothetical protein
VESGASVTQAADDHEMAEDHGVIPAVAADHARSATLACRCGGSDVKEAGKKKKTVAVKQEAGKKKNLANTEI